LNARRASIVWFVLGASAAIAFTLALLGSAKPPIPGPEAAVLVVGALICGGAGSSWLANGRSVRYLELYEVPTWPPFVWFVNLAGGMGFGIIWVLGVFLLVRSVG